MRNTLLKEQKIKLVLASDESQTREFTIKSTLGVGANCIAYHAFDVIAKIPVVLKECFPQKVANREGGATISWSDSDEEKNAKNRFINSVERQRAIQSDEITANTNAHLIDGLYIGNNTLYSIIDISIGKTYDKITDSKLQDVFKTIKAISVAVGKYHNAGYLHLDIKPQNVFVIPETREMVKLIDFDSVLPKSDVLSEETKISYSQNYAAPELEQGRRKKLCEATDIYSIGTILFEKIFGALPTVGDRSTFSAWNFDGNPLFKGLSKKVSRLTEELLRKTLAASVSKRYQNVKEFIYDIELLIEESDPKRRFLQSTVPPIFNDFAGRTTEISQIHSAFFSGKKAVILHGMGGIGKTELAKAYAKQFGREFDTIAYGRYESSLESLFRSADFIPIANNSEGEISIDAVRDLVNERTLLIIDNFDTTEDSSLDAILSLNCKFLFTSRCSFKDIAGGDSFSHILISKLPLPDQISIFESNCKKELSDEDLETVKLILNAIEGYTLLIPLIAKAYKNDDYTLKEISKKIEVAGLKNASEIDISHYKDKTISGTVYQILVEVLNMSKLSDDEIHVMRSLSVLSGIIIDRKVFNSWLGNEAKYKNALNSLVEKSWVQLDSTTDKKKVFLHGVIGDVARNELKPSLENCSWAKELCDKLISEMNSSCDFDDLDWDAIEELELEGFDLNGIDDEYVELSRIRVSDYEKERKSAKTWLFISILNNLINIDDKNAIIMIGNLFYIFTDESWNGIEVEYDVKLTNKAIDLCEMITTSDMFNSFTTEYKITTYKVICNLLLSKLISSSSYSFENENEAIRNGFADKIIACINNAEKALGKYPKHNLLSFILPIMEYVIQRSPMDIPVHLCKFIGHFVEGLVVPKDKFDIVTETYTKYCAEFRPERQEYRLFNAIFGYANEEDRQDDLEYERKYGYSDISKAFDKYFVREILPEALINGLQKLTQIKKYHQTNKIHYLIEKVSVFGFDPLDSHRCKTDGDANRARVVLKTINALLEEINFSDDWLKSMYYAQELMVSSFARDSESIIVALIKKCCDCSSNDLTLLFECLEALECHDTAEQLVLYQIRKLEMVKKDNYSQEELYDTFGSVIQLSRLINDNQRVKEYEQKQKELLDLGFVVR